MNNNALPKCDCLFKLSGKPEKLNNIELFVMQNVLNVNYTILQFYCHVGQKIFLVQRIVTFLNV